MANVYIDQLSQGMVLNSDVKDQSGRLLLKAGTELTEKHLYVFRSWGVTEVDIRGVSAEEATSVVSEDIDPGRLTAAEESLSRFFPEGHCSHPAMKELFRLCALRKARHAR